MPQVVAGYSGTPLAQKLGVVEGTTLAMLTAPPGWAIELPPRVAVRRRAGGHADVVVATDLTDNAIRSVALPRGLIDNKVCAIDETWSALRLVWRRENRVGAGGD